MAESTALEALTAELLGDVGLLHDQIKAMPGLLDNTIQQAIEELQTAASQIERQTNINVDTARQIEERLVEIRQETQALINSSIQAEVEQAKISISEAGQTIFAATLERISTEASGYMAATIDQHMAGHIEAVNRLNDAIAAATYRVDRIRPASRWEPLMYACLGMLVGASVILAIFVEFVQPRLH